MAGTYEKPNTSRVNIVPVWQENGAGVMGLATGITLLPNKTNLKIVIAEKKMKSTKTRWVETRIFCVLVFITLLILSKLDFVAM